MITQILQINSWHDNEGTCHPNLFDSATWVLKWSFAQHCNILSNAAFLKQKLRVLHCIILSTVFIWWLRLLKLNIVIVDMLLKVPVAQLYLIEQPEYSNNHLQNIAISCQICFLKAKIEGFTLHYLICCFYFRIQIIQT